MQAPTESAGAYAHAGAPRAPSSPSTPGAPAVPRAARITIERATTPAGIDSIRRALVLAEVLRPPICLRTDTDPDAVLGLFGLRSEG